MHNDLMRKHKRWIKRGWHATCFKGAFSPQGSGADEARSDRWKLEYGAGIMNTRHKDTIRSNGKDSAKPVGHSPSHVQLPKSRIRVLIADDHGVVREGLVSMIQRNRADMTVVGEASNGRDAIELWKQQLVVPTRWHQKICRPR
jgi:hypothetical protein